MKKVLLLSLSLAIGFGAYAQDRVAKSDVQSFKANAKKEVVGKETVNPSAASFAPQTAKSVVVNRFENMEYTQTMYTNYDLQSNSWCSNRMYQLENGNVGIVATFSHQENQQATDRGTGYNFYNAETEEWQEEPEQRVEPFRTGWPTICQYGEEGEVMISHAPVHCWIREKAGEGEWVDMGLLPDHPEAYPYDEDLAWPRVATTGDNHDIIHVIADLQHSGDVVEHHQVYYRSEDGGQTWIADFSPLQQDGEEANHYSADAYNIASNGHTVAIIYSDDLQSHVVMYKSTDDGQTWNRTVIWENPYYGCDWETDPCSVFTEEMYGPTNVAIAIDNRGVVHVALSTYEYIHDEIGSTYTTYSGRAVDGIYYWNDTQEAPIQAEDGNPHNAMRLWWPIPDDPDYVEMHNDSTKWAGFLPMFEDANGALIPYENDKFYRESDYFYKFRSGQSGMPALSIDPMGNIACAYSAPCTKRDGNELGVYYRSIFVSYYNVDEGYWHQVIDELIDDFMFGYSEFIFTISVNNTANPGEFWFGFQDDEFPGLYWGSNATQAEATENYIHAVKIIADPEYVSVPENHDAINPMTEVRVYPNPATDYINVEVNASQNSEMSINVFNIMGQKVAEQNVNIKTGLNRPTINTSDLNSGIYFVTVKANGFENTQKFIVK